MGDTKSISTTSSGSKRKKTAPGFYAVTVGHRPGIYQNWEDVQRQVKGYPGGYQRKFDTEEDAGHFLRTGQLPDKPQTKYYAVRGGPNPGVYKSWDEAKQHVHGHTGVKHKSFPYEEEAWAFLHTVDGQSTAASVVPSTAPSIKGEYGSETPLTDIRKGCKISDSPAKKQKMNGGYATTTLTNDEFEAGTGPLPHNAEDGFDRRLKLNPVSGILQYKTGRELAARKLQPNGDFSGTLVIYTDGSALGNGTAGAVGGLGVWFGPNDPRNVSEPLHGEKQSNQRAELMACKRAMDIAPIDRTVEIRTDSNYSIQCLTKWFVGWEKGNKWLNSAGKPVENRDIIEPTIARIREREQAGAKTIFVHVYGHTGHDGNEAADALAKNGAREASLQPEVADD
ncbi:ribonuclease H-like domain-containing protein [Dendryphion nanum]|uniref:ribonuclease H n=1 Tax=Dendryphion nanum TaxID=256645 RepID=A0A9P9DF12_9PLEO|nr:ribonuclease H-like domain-containing protein [Dendryphion nanum]